MTVIPLSRAGKAYVWAVAAAGSVAVVYALVQLALSPPHGYWLLVAALMLFAGPFAIRIPSLRTTISASEAFVFALVLFFGPAPATATVALDGVFVSLRAKNRTFHRAVFAITEPALSVWVSAQLFYALTGGEPLFNQTLEVLPLLLPLHALVACHFLLNSFLTATAAWLESQVTPLQFLRNQSLHLSLSYIASACLVLLLALNAGQLGVAAVGVLIPLLAILYISSKVAVERTETQAALRESEARFRELAQHINEVLWVVDAESADFLYVSPAYERIWGRPLNTGPGQRADWTNGIHEADRERVRNALRENALTGTFKEECRVVRPDGTTRWVNASGFPVKDQDGLVRRIVGTAEDVTERRKLEHQLVRSQKMEGIGRLAGGIAHDFNNVLTAILGYSELVLMQIDKSKPIWNDIHEIRKAGKRAASLTRQLLAFSRQQVLKMDVLDLNTVVRDVEKMLQCLIGDDIVIDTHLASDLRHIKADASQLEQILVNLAVNARDAMDRGGTLAIKTANMELDDTDAVDCVLPRGRYTTLVVSDTGCGMDEPTRAHVFEPFFTTKEIGKGTGLGLSTVYGTVKQLGGYIALDTRPLQGTTFTIYLPQTGDRLEPATARHDSSLPVGKERVLLVEDDEAVRTFAASVLRRVGYSVREAGTPNEALALSRNADVPFDLFLTDVVMPDMNGKEMVDLLPPGPHAKVLYMSGYSEDFFGSGILHAARDPLLRKPFTADALLRAVRRVLDGRTVAVNEHLDHSAVSVGPAAGQRKPGVGSKARRPLIASAVGELSSSSVSTSV